MNRKIVLMMICLLFSCAFIHAQEEQQKSDLEKRAEAVDPKEHIAQARSLFIHAFNDYANRGRLRRGVECAVRASALYYKENYYKEAFDLLRRADQTVTDGRDMTAAEKSALHYLVSKERMQMYLKMRKSESVRDQLAIMDNHASQSGDVSLQNDLLYNKAIFYYTFGQNAQGNAVFKEMASKLTSQKEYDKVDEVYQTLIANGRKSGNANMVAQSYSSYILWKDSVNALKAADVEKALKEQIAQGEATIAEKDSSLTTRQMIIVGLSILAAALAAVLILGAIVLMRFILLSRKQKKTIRLLNESNALKAQFIGNISAQLEPTLKRLDGRMPEVKALLDFSSHIQTLSELEHSASESVELEETLIPPFCNALMDQIRNKVKSGVTLTVNVPNSSAKINKDYVSHILAHLLGNAAEFTPEGGTICLDFKKRGPHTFQFLVSDTGECIPEEKRDDIFKPFVEIHDLTKGDGLGLPICKVMAVKMNGDLVVDSSYTKGTRFMLDLHV